MKLAIKYPKPFLHDHPPVVDVNKVFEEQIPFSLRMADRFSKVVGFWKRKKLIQINFVSLLMYLSKKYFDKTV